MGALCALAQPIMQFTRLLVTSKSQRSGWKSMVGWLVGWLVCLLVLTSFPLEILSYILNSPGVSGDLGARTFVFFSQQRGIAWDVFCCSSQVYWIGVTLLQFTHCKNQSLLSAYRLGYLQGRKRAGRKRKHFLF